MSGSLLKFVKKWPPKKYVFHKQMKGVNTSLAYPYPTFPYVDLSSLNITNENKTFYMKAGSPWGSLGNDTWDNPYFVLDNDKKVQLWYYAKGTNTGFPEHQVYNGSTNNAVGWDNLGDNLILSWEIDDTECRVNGNTYTLTNVAYENILGCYPFGRYGNPSYSDSYIIYLEEFGIKNSNGKYLCRYLPCEDTEENKKGLLDMVNRMFFEVPPAFTFIDD